MRHTTSEIIDFAVIAGLTVAGMYRLNMILIALGAAALAAGPIAQYHAAAREHQHIDSGRMVRSITIDAALLAIAGSIAAYLAGRLLALLWGW